MKGKSTQEKLDMLKDYFTTESLRTDTTAQHDEDVEIRVDNYIKALSRGGQLFPGESLDRALKLNWQLPIKR